MKYIIPIRIYHGLSLLRRLKKVNRSISRQCENYRKAWGYSKDSRGMLSNEHHLRHIIAAFIAFNYPTVFHIKLEFYAHFVNIRISDNDLDQIGTISVKDKRGVDKYTIVHHYSQYCNMCRLTYTEMTEDYNLRQKFYTMDITDTKRLYPKYAPLVKLLEAFK